ncbi:MAG: GDP-L-fucose synthase [Deltaproteobacteria bacterium]|nr:MAG: GDP-L-fucose synthase [Deltaproteobacteria bacterium]
MERDSLIFLAGHKGLVGSALLRQLKAKGYGNLIVRSHAELDLERQSEVESFFDKERPEYVFLAAAKVGGIWANNTYPAEFIYKNLAIQTNVIHAAWKTGIKRLAFLGSSCIYPRECPQPMNEEHLLSGTLEATNEPYAVAKIAGVKMCESYNRQYGANYVALMPTNLYGPNDNFDLETSHVLPALIRKFHEAKQGVSSQQSAVSGRTAHLSTLATDQPSQPVVIWGTGEPRREFLHVDDLADACIFIMNLDEEDFRPLVSAYRTPLINIGWGKDISIKELALIVKEVIGFEGEMTFDTTKPDGTPRKLLDINRINRVGWSAKISLREGIKLTYKWCLENSIF